MASLPVSQPTERGCAATAITLDPSQFEQFDDLSIAASATMSSEFGSQRDRRNTQVQCGIQRCQCVGSADGASYVDGGAGGVGGYGAVDQI
jgi:hypothetical protein